MKKSAKKRFNVIIVNDNILNFLFILHFFYYIAFSHFSLLQLYAQIWNAYKFLDHNLILIWLIK